MRNSYSSKAIVLLGYGLLASALLLAAGCQSLGKRNPLSSSEIPVLTRNEDVEYPPPSAAAAPTAISTGADSGSQLANSPSNLIANSGDQTTAGIEYPSTQPNASAAAAPGNYPATNYQAFPKQPEALSQTSPATQNAGGFVGTASQPSAARASNEVATSPAPPTNSAAVQQGLYPMKPTSTATGPSTPQAATTASGGGNWPVPLATTESAPAAPRSPVDQATHTTPRSDAGGYGSRASEFGGTVAETITSSADSAATSPPAAPIATYVDPTGPGVATAADASASSHYEQMSTASAPSPKTEWRPGSTSNLPKQR